MSNRRRSVRAPRTTFLSGAPGQSVTRWNDEPVTAVKIAVMVADAPEFPQYWARQYVNHIRQAVRVDYRDQRFYLDNEDGSGWRKVTEGCGSPRWPHRNLAVTVEVIEATI